MIKSESPPTLVDVIPIAGHVKRAVIEGAKSRGEEWAQDQFEKRFAIEVSGMLDEATIARWFKLAQWHRLTEKAETRRAAADGTPSYLIWSLLMPFIPLFPVVFIPLTWQLRKRAITKGTTTTWHTVVFAWAVVCFLFQAAICVVMIANVKIF